MLFIHCWMLQTGSMPGNVEVKARIESVDALKPAVTVLRAQAHLVAFEIFRRFRTAGSFCLSGSIF